MGNIDILVLTETKLDHTFPTNQFLIEGFSEPYRRDRNGNGGGILIYVREDIPSKELREHNFPEDIEGIFVEINMRKCKLLLLGSYHPPSQSDNYYFDILSNSLDLYINKYDRFLLTGDFNAEDTEPVLENFLEQYSFKNIVKEDTCFKNPKNPSCIDLFITNCPMSFQNTKVLANGLSDFHKMPITVLKLKFQKAKPKEVTYRDYKKFNGIQFKHDLKLALQNGYNTYESFDKIVLETLDKHAPLKKKIIRANHAPYMTKQLRKAIMHRSQLQTKYFKTKKDSDNVMFKKQINYVSRLYKKEKKNFYENLDIKVLQDNKQFWKVIKNLFSDKSINAKQITLVNGEDIISEDPEVSKTFQTFFKEAVSKLGIKENECNINLEADNIDDPIVAAIAKFKSHPSILKIIENLGDLQDRFKFKSVNTNDMKKQFKNLNPKKASTYKTIPTKILKENEELCSPPLLEYVNNTLLQTKEFPNTLKIADVHPIYKPEKKDATNVEHYRPISVLPAASKIFERIMQIQIAEYMDEHLSPYLCGYRVGFSAQHALISLIEKWRITLDKRGYAGAVLMDLSKAFDCLNHDLLIAKLHAYGFNKDSLYLIRNFLKNRWQRVKINTSFSSWYELLVGVPQGSVLGPLLFNIYLNDLFFINENTNVCNYADDTTLHTSDQSLQVVLDHLENDSLLAIKWFEDNYMKLNPDKCHLLVAGHKYEKVSVKVGNETILESREEKLLGIKIDNNLKFKTHIYEICKKAGSKLTAIARQCNMLSFEKLRTLLLSFVHSQFSYSPLVWMFHNRKENSQINRIHERALRILYRDDISSFEELLDRDGSFTVHQRNIQSLAIEMYKAKNNLGPSLLKDIFVERQYNGPTLRSNTYFVKPSINSVHFGKDSLRFFGNTIWNLLPNEMKIMVNFNKFKTLIKKWKPDSCPCRLCIPYIKHLGHVGYVE